jgi:formylglycine-generating enzyme required for sulfatase activity
MSDDAGSTARRVLISYSHDSEQHREAVLALAQALRSKGIDAWIDQFEPTPPQGWPRWIVEQVHRSDYVVMICTTTYKRRFEGREQAGVGRGVSYEGLLARQLLYEGKFDHQTLVPVLLPGATTQDIPLEVRAGTHHTLPEELDELVARLTDRLAVEPAPLEPVAEPASGMPDEPDDDAEDLASLYENFLEDFRRRSEPAKPKPRLERWMIVAMGAVGVIAALGTLAAVKAGDDDENPRARAGKGQRGRLHARRELESANPEIEQSEPPNPEPTNREPTNPEPANPEPAIEEPPNPEPTNGVPKFEPVNSGPAVIVAPLAPDADPRCDFSRAPAFPTESFGEIGDPATGSSCGIVRTTLANSNAPIDLVGLTGGQFTMGSPPDEPGRDDKELQHRVLLQSFAICETEVSQEQFAIVTGKTPSDCTYADACGDDLPVQSVTWFEIAGFMNALTRWDNHHGEGEDLTECYDETTWAWRRDCTGYRLPTEAEWEYAVRATSATPWSFGADEANICKYANSRPYGACEDGFELASPVETDRLQPNAWGLHGMHGNLWESVFDTFGPYDGQNVTMPVHDDLRHDGTRVLRGGSFELWPKSLRSAKRYSVLPEQGSAYFGFRCAMGALPRTTLD